MFNPLKGAGDAAKMISEARKIQKALQEITINESKGRVSVEITGDMKVKSFTLNDEEMRDAVDCLNDAIEKAQKKAASKMQEMGGGLAGLLGGK